MEVGVPEGGKMLRPTSAASGSIPPILAQILQELGTPAVSEGPSSSTVLGVDAFRPSPASAHVFSAPVTVSRAS